MENYICEHCRGGGAVQGHFSDEHVDVIECIEAQRNQIADLQRELAELKQMVAMLRQGPMFLDTRHADMMERAA